MSVVVYKDGERSLVEPAQLRHALENGYSLKRIPLPVEKSVDKPKRIRRSKEQIALDDAAAAEGLGNEESESE